MRRNLPAFLISVLCALALVFSACDSGGGGGGGGSSSPSPASLKVPLPSNDARSGSYTSGDAASYLVSISSSKHSDSKSGTPGAVVEFVNIPVGTYTVKVEAKNSNGNTIATATSTATVSGGSSSSVSLKLSPLEYYEVKFMDNDGNVVTQMKVTVGDKFTLPKCDLKAPDGMKFSQWGVMDSDGKTIILIVSVGDTYKPKNDIEFHAIWIDKDAHNIKYENILETDTVAGDTTRPTSFKETDNVTLPNMVRAGYTFNGWYLDLDFTGSAITGWNANEKKDDVTLYAKWTAITYKVKLHNNDENPNFNILDCTYDVNISLFNTIPTRTGYTFKGWAETSGAENPTYTYNPTVPLSSIKNLSSTDGAEVNLYAVWEALVPQSLTVNGTPAVQHENEAFDPTGLTFTVTLSDGTTVNVTDGITYEIAGSNSTSFTMIGTQPVTVKFTYNETTVSSTIDNVSVKFIPTMPTGVTLTFEGGTTALTVTSDSQQIVLNAAVTYSSSTTPAPHAVYGGGTITEVAKYHYGMLTDNFGQSTISQNGQAATYTTTTGELKSREFTMSSWICFYVNSYIYFVDANGNLITDTTYYDDTELDIYVDGILRGPSTTPSVNGTPKALYNVFTGTVGDFNALTPMPTANQSAPYKFVISGVNSDNFPQILSKLNIASSLFFELDLSDSSLTAFGVTTFNDYSTAAYHLTAISLPSSIVKLAYAFGDCTNLTSVVVAREYTDGIYTLLPGESNGSDNRTKIGNGSVFE